MIVVGLTGGPCSGKTSVAEILKENGAIILSGDEIGRRIVDENPAILNELVRTFGKQILDQRRKLNRRKLGKIVFANPQALYKLNEIIHPPLLRILKAELTKHLKRGSKKIIVIDAALIFEWGIANWCNLILVVTAIREVRIRRMIRNGLARKEAEDRIASQLPERDKVSLADYVIRNNGTKAALRRGTLEFLKVLKVEKKGQKK